MYDAFDKAMVAFLIVIVIVGLYAVSLGVTGIIAEAECLEHGYPTAAVTWNYDTYCVSNFNNQEETRKKVMRLD